MSFLQGEVSTLPLPTLHDRWLWKDTIKGRYIYFRNLEECKDWLEKHKSELPPHSRPFCKKLWDHSPYHGVSYLIRPAEAEEQIVCTPDLDPTCPLPPTIQQEPVGNSIGNLFRPF